MSSWARTMSQIGMKSTEGAVYQFDSPQKNEEAPKGSNQKKKFTMNINTV